MASKIEVRPEGKYLNDVRVYSKSEAAAILDCDKMYVAKLVDLDKIHEVGYAPYMPGVETLALFVDAASVDAYKLVFRHKDDNMAHQFVIEILPEQLEQMKLFLEHETNMFEGGEYQANLEPLKALFSALCHAEDLTEARRRYNARKAKAKEGVTEGHIEKA